MSAVGTPPTGPPVPAAAASRARAPPRACRGYWPTTVESIVLEISHQHPKLRPGAHIGVWAVTSRSSPAAESSRAPSPVSLATLRLPDLYLYGYLLEAVDDGGGDRNGPVHAHAHLRAAFLITHRSGTGPPLQNCSGPRRNANPGPDPHIAAVDDLAGRAVGDCPLIGWPPARSGRASRRR